jgi:hypothetical protein
VLGAAHAVVALHGTDPATTVLSALARTTAATPADVERALYDDRSLVRVLSMRRTVFAVPRDLVGTCLAGASDIVARQQRALLLGLLADAGIAEADAWLDRAERVALAAIAAAGEVTSTELAAADPMLATRLQIGRGQYAATPTVASRLLTQLSAEGHVVRTRPRGGWTSTQFRWSTMADWCDIGARPGPDTAVAELARRWLHAYGPATLDDLQWWTGWTKGRTVAAVASLPTTEVLLDGGALGVALTDDLDPLEPPEPWVALLPALDPSAMAWKHRDVVLGPHRGEVFDLNGNAGPTVWADGAIVGGWAQRDDGEVAVHLLQDVGAEHTAAIQRRAAELTATLGDVRLKARARGWTALEKTLRA